MMYTEYCDTDGLLPSPACGRGAGGEGAPESHADSPSPLTPLPLAGEGDASTRLAADPPLPPLFKGGNIGVLFKGGNTTARGATA